MGAGGSGAEWLKGPDGKLSGEDLWPAQEKGWSSMPRLGGQTETEWAQDPARAPDLVFVRGPRCSLFPPWCAPQPSLELSPAVRAHCHSSCSWAMGSCCQDMDLVLITVSANTVNLLLRERVFENVHSGYNFSAAPAVCAQLIPDMVLWNSNHCIYKKARTHKYVTSGIYNAIFHHFLF